MHHAYVIGLGKSGIAAARLLAQEGWAVTVSDRNSSEALQQTAQQLQIEGIAVRLGDTFHPDPEQMQRIVVSPGVPWDLPALNQARDSGIETLGEMELAWRSLAHIPWVGITGTNGKTTTTALVAAIFKAAGLNAPACGNIGYAACDLALQAQRSPLDWVVAEVSSYQIESAPTLAPKISVWTTFTPDHLNRHYTLENYFNLKARLLQQAADQVINGNDLHLHQVAPALWPDAWWTSTAGLATIPGNLAHSVYIEDAWVRTPTDLIMPLSLLRMPGDHNQQNLLMAIAVARLAGIGKEAIAQAISTFPGVPHRLEQICTWNGIQFINDSKATNYDAADVGLASVEAPVILIAGGEAKTGDDNAWIQRIQTKAAAVLLIGAAAPAFAQRLAAAGYHQSEIVETMERAIDRGATLAQQRGARVVLLSPACASFDQYRNFEERGDHFRHLCLERFHP
jgi:UDP-N-acetylmuramoylalanine--D-glutamate ligase